MNRQQASRLPRRSSIQISNQWNKQTSVTVDPIYDGADPDKWIVKTQTFNAKFQGGFNKEEVNGQLITDGIEKFKSDPIKYAGIMYKTDEMNKPIPEQGYCLILRDKVFKVSPIISPDGQYTIMTQYYRRLPPLKNDTLPKLCRDEYTDDIIYKGKKLHTKANKPLLPGRGMGLLDQPNMKLIGTIDPSDVKQGLIADCWLLSGISTLAEFEGAIQRIFRKTKNLDSMPFDDKPNLYTITLWDISTWTEVDIVIDERLCSRPDSQNRQGEMKLLGAKPSDDGELWVPYLEKAVSIHCGGWDKISYGANCNHAWAILTGVKEQCTILRVGDETTNWGCYAKYDPYAKKFAELDNDPWQGCQSVWTVPWPTTSGGSFADWKNTSELNDEQLFQKMCEWDDGNFLMACSSKGQSDRENTDGIVNKHAYGVVECKDNVSGTGLDMIQLRNPWGKGGELENAEFERGKGPGWKKYPQLKNELNPDQDSPGVFWLTKREFFKYYDKVYLSASDMSEFLGLKPKRDKPKDEEEMEADTKKRKAEETPNAPTSPAKKTTSIKKETPKKASPIKAKPKGFVKVEKNIPKKGKGKKSGGFFKAIPGKKGSGFQKMVPRNKQQEMAKAKLEREKKEKEKLEKERQEQERIEKEKQEKEKKERERQEREKLEKEKQARQSLEREKQAKAKQERDRLEKERKAKLQLEKQERDRKERERKARESQEKESKSPLAFGKFMGQAKKGKSSSHDSDRGNQDASKELQEKDATIADLQRRLDEAEKESMKLRSETTALTAIQEDLQAEVETYEEQLETKEKVIDALTEDVNRAYENAGLQGNTEELREKTEELSGKTAEIAKLKKELAKARSSALAQSDQKHSAKSDQKALVLQHRREMNEKDAIIASMQKEIDNGKRRISALKDDASELRSANQDLENLKKRQKRKIEQLEKEDGAVSSLRADLQKAKRTIKDLSQSKSESQRDLAKKDKRIDFLRSELREANQAIQSLEKKIGGSRDRDRVRLNQYKKQLQDKEAELDSKDAKLKNAEKAGFESRKRLREKDERINTVLDQLQQSRKQGRALEGNNEGLRKKLKNSEQHVSFLVTQLEEAKHLVQTLEQRNRASRDREVARLRNQLETKQKEANNQKHQLQQAKEDVQSGGVALRKKEQESIELRGALRQLRQEYQSLEQEKNDMYARENRKLKQLQSRLNNTQVGLETEREKRKQADDRADDLEEEINRERQKRQRTIEEQATDNSKNQVPGAGQLLKDKEEELNFMGKKLRRMILHQQQSSRHLVNEMTQKDSQISDLQQQVDELQQENEALYQKNANQSSQSKRVHELEIELDKQKKISEVWKEDVGALQDTMDEQKNRLEKLDLEIADKDSLIQSLEQKVAEQAVTMAQKSTASARHAKSIADLNRKLEATQEQLKRRRIEGTSDGSSRERMDELERELWEARDDSDSLRHTIKLQEAELEEKEAVISSLARRLKERSQHQNSIAERLPGLVSTAERGRKPSSTALRAQEQGPTAQRARTLNFAAEIARDPSFASVRAREQNPSPSKDRLLQPRNAEMSLDLEETGPENQEIAEIVQSIEHLQPEYDGVLSNPNSIHVSQAPSFGDQGAREQRPSTREYPQLPPRSARAGLEPDEASPGNREISKRPEARGAKQPGYNTQLHSPNLRHLSRDESFGTKARGHSHIHTPVLPEYTSRTKSDPPERTATVNFPGGDDKFGDTPSHLIHHYSLPPEVDGENRAMIVGHDEPKGEKWDEQEHRMDAPETENEFGESKIAETLKWNDKSDFQAPHPKGEIRNHRDFANTRLANNEECDVHMTQPRDMRRTTHSDIYEASGIDEEEWADVPSMREWDNGRNSHIDFKEAIGIDDSDSESNIEPRMHHSYGRDKRSMKHGDFDETDSIDGENWNEEPHMYTSNPREYGHTARGNADDHRISEEYKWKEERDIIASNPSYHETQTRHRDFDRKMHREDEKSSKAMDIPTSRPEGHSARRDYNGPREMEDGKWNEELGIYIQPTVASRYYQDCNDDPSQSLRETNNGRQITPMESSANRNSPWYYDLQSPIGNWNEGWDSNLRGRAKDHRHGRDAPGVRILNYRGDAENESLNFEEENRQRGYSDGESDQFSANAHIIGSMNSWAQSTGHRQQQKLLSHAVQGKEDRGADSINDYLARLFEKVQATKSELEATQKRLNHTVGRHLAHE